MANVTPIAPPPTPPAKDSHVDIAVAVARELLDRAPAAVREVSRMRNGALWVAVLILTIVTGVHLAAFGLHLAGDGSLASRVSRIEELVEYLVLSKMAADRGEPPPPLPFRIKQ